MSWGTSSVRSGGLGHVEVLVAVVAVVDTVLLHLARTFSFLHIQLQVDVGGFRVLLVICAAMLPNTGCFQSVLMHSLHLHQLVDWRLLHDTAGHQGVSKTWVV